MILPSLTAEDISLILFQLLSSTILLVIILFISKYKALNIGNRIITAGIRGFLQLLTLSLFLTYIFSITSIVYQFLVLAFMIVFGALTISKRIDVDNIFWLEIKALSVSVYVVMSIVTIIGAIPISHPEIFIPIGGMAVGNAMNISYLTLNSIKKEIDNRKDQIEAALCLGFTP